MTTIQERLQIKREPLDKWSTREQLCLAFAVAKSGDQNWMSVSRMLKPFGEPNRPADWFHQKNCASQYGSLLENVEIPKRKKRTSGLDTTIETPVECILKKLTQERVTELEKLLLDEKIEYMKLQDEMAMLQSGTVSEELLDKWCKAIDDEEKQKEEENIKYAQWLKERELRKQEIERAWRPFGKLQFNSPQKRKAVDNVELMDVDVIEDSQHLQVADTAKPALSPLLTSLLKSPSQVQGVVTSSILHSAITSQKSLTSNSTIANLLNSTPELNTVPTTIQQLVNNAISQESNVADSISSDSITNDLLEDAVDSLPNIKVEDLESTILSSDDPLPEMKNEEVEGIISDLIKTTGIVSDPERHIQLDDNEDLITNLDNELQVLCNEEKAAEEAAKEKSQLEKSLSKSDPFEFEEDPEISEFSKPTAKYQEFTDGSETVQDKTVPDPQKNIDETENSLEKQETNSGSVEIVEVPEVVGETEIDKQLNKTQILDIVHSIKSDNSDEITVTKSTKQTEASDSNDKESSVQEPLTSNAEEQPFEVAEKNPVQISTDSFSPDYSESFFDDLTMEVNKLDKTGKAKRDYSRTKKRESEKEFDILLAVEKAVNSGLASTSDLPEDISSDDKEYPDDKKLKIKLEIDRSNSPWTEEEDVSTTRSKRRYSTPATPSDSVPNSPASSSACVDEDREYRTWKKSIMLLYNRLTTHKFASLFLKPITDDMAPGYHTLIYKPLDLHTIRKNIENGAIRTTPELQRDLLLMFTNAIMYNKTNEFVYNMTKQMQVEAIQQLQIFQQAQQSDAPQRRETRTSEPNTNKRKRISDESLSRNKKRKED